MLKRIEKEQSGKIKVFSFDPESGSLSCSLVETNLKESELVDYLRKTEIINECDRVIINPSINGGYSAPFKIYVDITDACQMNCKHCLNNRLNGGNELSFNTLKCIADECEKLGVFYVKLGGGEPLLHPKFMETVEYFRKKGIYVSLSTNGYLIDDILGEFFKTNNIRVTVSVEGNRIIDEMIRGRGHFDVALNALEILKKHRVNTALRVTLTRYMLNREYFDELFDIARHHDVPLKVSYCRPAGLSKENECLITKNDERDYYDIMYYLNERINDYSIQMDEGMMYDQPQELDWLLYQGRMCGAANRSMHINSRAQLSPCVFMGLDYIESNSSYSFGDIEAYWVGEKGYLFKEVRNIPIPHECKACDGKCKFECLATRLHFSGKTSGYDPNCLRKRRN